MKKNAVMGILLWVTDEVPSEVEVLATEEDLDRMGLLTMAKTDKIWGHVDQWVPWVGVAQGSGAVEVLGSAHLLQDTEALHHLMVLEGQGFHPEDLHHLIQIGDQCPLLEWEDPWDLLECNLQCHLWDTWARWDLQDIGVGQWDLDHKQMEITRKVVMVVIWEALTCLERFGWRQRQEKARATTTMLAPERPPGRNLRETTSKYSHNSRWRPWLRLQVLLPSRKMDLLLTVKRAKRSWTQIHPQRVAPHPLISLIGGRRAPMGSGEPLEWGHLPEAPHLVCPLQVPMVAPEGLHLMACHKDHLVMVLVILVLAIMGMGTCLHPWGLLEVGVCLLLAWDHKEALCPQWMGTTPWFLLHQLLLQQQQLLLLAHQFLLQKAPLLPSQHLLQVLLLKGHLPAV